MNINATLLVQALNFFIAYLLFRYILLGPAYAEIEQDEQERHSLHERIEQDKEAIERERQSGRHAWDSFRSFCRTFLPTIEMVPSFFKTMLPQLHMKEPREELKRDIKKQLTAKIVSYARERYDG